MTAITLALPAYNESENITTVLSECVSVLENLGRTWELLVIDNASTDDTAAFVNALAEGDERIRLIQHAENRLYSGSCETALQNARGDFVAIMDSDGQVTARDLPRFIELLEQGNNLVLGWRRERRDPFGRLLVSRFFNVLGKWYLRYPFHDLNCGYRMFDRSFIDAATILHRINLVNPELFTRARLADLRVAEVAVEHRERVGGDSSHDFRKLLRVFLDVRRYLRALGGELRGHTHR